MMKRWIPVVVVWTLSIGLNLLVWAQPVAIQWRRWKIQRLTQCYAAHENLGVVKVNFTDPNYMIVSPCYHPQFIGKSCPVLGFAMPYSGEVNISGMWINGQNKDFKPFPTVEQMDKVASHEIAHVIGIWDETEAEEHAVKMREEASCR